MIDHISLVVRDLDRARTFYGPVLAVLGQRRVMDVEDAPDYRGSGYGSGHEPQFWIGSGQPAPAVAPVPPEGQHVAFRAVDRATVDRFHATALAHGGRDNGVPGLRPHYHPNYYACFVIDLDGHHPGGGLPRPRLT